MDNKDKIILDLCGGSGAWSRPYREAGYTVYNITLPAYDVISAEAMLFEENVCIYFISKNNKCASDIIVRTDEVHGILCAPPCTEFSVAKGGRLRDLGGAMVTVSACMQIIWECRANGNLKFWALENPVGLLRQFLGIPRFTFEQWQYGGDKVKRTDLWGYFNEPIKTVHQRPDLYMHRNPGGSSNCCNWGKLECPSEHEDYIKSMGGYVAQRAAARAITPAGFARAFFRTNQ